jgi:hypothetical protein
MGIYHILKPCYVFELVEDTDNNSLYPTVPVLHNVTYPPYPLGTNTYLLGGPFPDSLDGHLTLATWLLMGIG